MRKKAESLMPAALSQRQVFICYRRNDAVAYAGRLYDALCKDFGEDNVFFDQGGIIDGGDDWKQVIDERLESCAALIVLIGMNWQPARIADPEDLVRREISSAFARGVRVIPILINDATLPSAADLPEEMRPLLSRQMMEMTDRHWRADYEQLAKSIRKEIARRQKPRKPALLIAALAALAVVLALVLFIAKAKWKTNDSTSLTEPTRSSTAQPLSSAQIRPIQTHTVSNSTTSPPAPVPTGPLLGVDAGSMKNGDWSNPELGNLSFAFVGDGHPEFSRLRQEIRARHLIFGAYQVLFDLRDPIAQAERFVQIVQPSEHDVLLGVNVSPLQIANQPTKDLSARLHQFLKRLEELTGKRPFIYVTTDSWNTNFDGTFGSYPLWLTKGERFPRGWSRVSLEQEVKDGGATITLRFTGTLKELEAYAKKR